MKSPSAIAQESIEKILAAIPAADASAVLANLNQKPKSRADSRVERLEATGMGGDQVAFIRRAWQTAERFGLAIDETTGQIKGGIHAIDKAFASADNQKHLGGDSVATRVRLKAEWRRAGIIGE
jgi:hypothetical protein